MSTDDIDWAAAFSIFSAAKDCPERLCVRTPEADFSFADIAQAVRADLAQLARPQKGRPYILTAKADLATLVRIYALLEARIPMLLLSPKLTAPEVRAYLDRVRAIDTALPEDAAAVLFTSGTTGRSKPAILTYRSLSANARAVSSHIRLTGNDVWQLSISPARVGGFGVLTRSLFCRSAVALAPNYSAKDYIERIEKDGITIASLVPTMLSDMLEYRPDWRAPSTLRLVLIGGAACLRSLRQKAVGAGIAMVTTYAMTETASTVAMSAFEKRLEVDAGGNVPLDGVELKSAEGELFVRGPMTMYGYWGAKPLAQGQWLDTGDRATTLSDGSFEILGRSSDTIVSGGEKVYPDEVQKALDSIDGISSSLVLGIPDEKWGSIVTALLVAKNKPIAKDSLVAKLTKKLARYKCPRRIAWVKALPRTSEGKFSRRSEILGDMALETVHYTSQNIP